MAALERGVLRMMWCARSGCAPRAGRAREVVGRSSSTWPSSADDEDVAHRAQDVAGPDRGLDQVDARRAQRRGQRGQEPREVRPFDDERRRVARRRVVGLDLERVAVGRAGFGEVPRLEVRALPRIDEEQVEEAQRAARDDARERAEEADAPRRGSRAARPSCAGRSPSRFARPPSAPTTPAESLQIWPHAYDPPGVYQG